MEKKKKLIIIIIVSVIIIGIIVGIIICIGPKKEPINSIKREISNDCNYSYNELCFKIPEDYKCVGNNKCQLSNDKDMLLVQVYLEENYKDSLKNYIKNDKIEHVVEKQEEKKFNNQKWIVGKNKYKDEKYYYTKTGNNIYKIEILSMRDSGDKFDQLTKTIERSIKIKKK